VDDRALRLFNHYANTEGNVLTTMTQSYSAGFSRLQYLQDSQQTHLLQNGLKGIEKESLRLAADGLIAQTPHSKALGSALTHPQITTDYSEALIELITPPFTDVADTLQALSNIHQFVYDNLDGEILLATSMPCGIDGDDSIPIARYGSSNIGRMKHIYRHGLWHRYGRTMQAIAGIHFNYSLPMALWPVLHQHENSSLSLEQFISDSYFGLVRNFQRVGWIILYLFGASPAICKSFFKSRPQLMAQFEPFDDCTLYLPYATSLRMSDIGYKSKNQLGLKVDYNSLPGYVDSLTKAINTPFPEYVAIGVLVEGEYRQLNSNILQIENEFYSIIRPKQVAQSGEKPTLALKRRGVRYVEMRSLDLDFFNPIGISDYTARFAEVLLLACLLKDSPPITETDHAINNRNQLAVANTGRQPGLLLERNGSHIPLTDWAHSILDDVAPICALLDAGRSDTLYQDALAYQRRLVVNPDLTASAQMLATLQQQDKPFGCFGLEQSFKHAEYFKQRHLDADTNQQFITLAEQSLAKQQAIENQDQLPFADFLTQYFAQG
jgi:glutamate--cysteine ligase